MGHVGLQMMHTWFTLSQQLVVLNPRHQQPVHTESFGRFAMRGGSGGLYMLTHVSRCIRDQQLVAAAFHQAEQTQGSQGSCQTKHELDTSTTLNRGML